MLSGAMTAPAFVQSFAVLDFLVDERAISEELRSRMLG